MKPVCHVVAGPNGAGKSTFALDYLPKYAGSIEYVNPDLMASGLSPIDIRLSALKSGRLALERIAMLIEARATFGFETTLSGRGHLKLLADADWRLNNLKEQFRAAGVALTPDVWDRLEADRRQALEDDLAWIRRGREETVR